ncbi:MAG: riboflavin biosynthesis protein RibD [Thermoactinospora sp.]|nr:riboflavin biosynthesis protein RibD [Thermoactinospora sp.]
MRKLVASLFISLDGVVEAPDQWQFAFDDEMGEEITTVTSQQDAILLGRVSYQEWAGYWPTSDEEPFAGWINQTPKYVVSTTLESTDEWQNSTLLTGDLSKAVTELKNQPGGGIGVGGSPTLVRSLLELDLLDELRLLIHPVVAGKGAKLFDNGELKKLELVEAKPTSSGTVIVAYRPAR